MYKTDYFIRFVNSPAHAENDLRRGHSFDQYQFFDTEEDAREEAGPDDEVVPFEMDDGKTRFGIALPGLAGFGPFETVDEAEDAGRNRRGYNGVEWPMFTIYEGRHVGDAQDGDLFRPEKIIKHVRLGAKRLWRATT